MAAKEPCRSEREECAFLRSYGNSGKVDRLDAAGLTTLARYGVRLNTPSKKVYTFGADFGKQSYSEKLTILRKYTKTGRFMQEHSYAYRPSNFMFPKVMHVKAGDTVSILPQANSDPNAPEIKIDVLGSGTVAFAKDLIQINSDIGKFVAELDFASFEMKLLRDAMNDFKSGASKLVDESFASIYGFEPKSTPDEP